MSSNSPTIYDDPTKEDLELIKMRLRLKEQFLEREMKREELVKSMDYWIFRVGSMAFTIAIIVKIIVFIFRHF